MPYFSDETLAKLQPHMRLFTGLLIDTTNEDVVFLIPKRNILQDENISTILEQIRLKNNDEIEAINIDSMQSYIDDMRNKLNVNTQDLLIGSVLDYFEKQNIILKNKRNSKLKPITSYGVNSKHYASKR